MGGWLKGLIATTCAAVLAALGWWGWSEWRSAEGRTEVAQAEADADRFNKELENEQFRQECRADVAAWDAGDRAAVIRKFGDAAERIIEECRYLIAAPAE